MLAEQPPDTGMAFRHGVVNEQNCLGCEEDCVIRPSDRILMITLPRRKFRRRQRSRGSSPLPQYDISIHSTDTPSRSTAFWNGYPLSFLCCHSSCV